MSKKEKGKWDQDQIDQLLILIIKMGRFISIKPQLIDWDKILNEIDEVLKKNGLSS